MHLLEFDYYLDPLGNEYNLHDGETYFMLSDTGHGMPPIEYITERGPLQHGETALDFRLRPRLITMLTRRRFPCRDDYWDGRSDLLDALRPNRQAIGQFDPGRLRKILPDGSMRDLDVFIESGPVFEPRALDKWDELAFTETLRFVAHDPVFYDPLTQAQVWVLTVDDNLIFYEAPGYLDRLVFPIWFTAAVISSYLNLTYGGTWPAYPTIIVTGPATNIIIENITTGERLELSYVIAAGEVVTFDLRYGHKTITNQWGDNLLPYLSADSDLATFHLEPDPGAAGGINQMWVFCSGADLNTSVEIQWLTRYIGL